MVKKRRTVRGPTRRLRAAEDAAAGDREVSTDFSSEFRAIPADDGRVYGLLRTKLRVDERLVLRGIMIPFEIDGNEGVYYAYGDKAFFYGTHDFGGLTSMYRNDNAVRDLDLEPYRDAGAEKRKMGDYYGVPLELLPEITTTKAPHLETLLGRIHGPLRNSAKHLCIGYYGADSLVGDDTVRVHEEDSFFGTFPDPFDQAAKKAKAVIFLRPELEQKRRDDASARGGLIVGGRPATTLSFPKHELFDKSTKPLDIIPGWLREYGRTKK